MASSAATAPPPTSANPPSAKANVPNPSSAPFSNPVSRSNSGAGTGAVPLARSKSNLRKDDGPADKSKGGPTKPSVRRQSNNPLPPLNTSTSNAPVRSSSMRSSASSNGGRSSSTGAAVGEAHRSNPQRARSPINNRSNAPRRGSENSNNTNKKSSASPPVANSSALDSLQQVISDLRSIPPSNHSSSSAGVSPGTEGPPSAPSKSPLLNANVPGFEPPKSSGPIPIVDPATKPQVSSTTKAPNPKAAVFHPSRPSTVDNSEEADTFEGMPPIPALSSRPQQQQQQPQMGSFVAPRFAALAAAERDDGKGSGTTNSGNNAQSQTGRPILAPQFTFGARRRSSNFDNLQPMGSIGSGGGAPTMSNVDEDQQMSSYGQASVAPGMGTLLGLAARAHRRTGSEMTPMMAEQVRLQQQIEELQAQQRELLLATQNATNQQLMGPPALPASAMGYNQQHDPMNRHRRFQSVAASPSVPTFGDVSIPQSGQQQPAFGSGGRRQSANFGSFSTGSGGLNGMIGSMSLGGPAAGGGSGLPSGHGRRHSVNVGNKNAGGFTNAGDWAEDGFGMGPQGTNGTGSGHQRNGSRMSMDSSWRINNGAGAVQSSNNMISDLAQAQAQLASIASFRAAAGGGHSKMASFALPNMLPNLLYANAPGVFNVPQQMQAFQLQINQQSSQPTRKSLFSPYLPAASLPPLLAAGKLVVGILRVNKRNRSDAYIATEVLDADIYISGSRDRNRALDGDTVAVELLDVDEVWASKKEKEDKKRKKEENAAYNDVRASNLSAVRKIDKKKDDVEVEGQGMMLFDDEEVTDEIKPQYAGHVVAVVERMPGQLFSGTLGLLRPSSAATKEKQDAERREREGPGHDYGNNQRGATERPKIIWFKPTDKRVPLIAIPTEQAPADFIENADAYVDTLFCACIKRWPITSLHPFGTLVEEIGPIGQIEVETSALLKDCNFPTEDFAESVMKCLPPLPWSIPERELESRKDYRQSCVFTIDPEGAKDLDDAVSWSRNDDGTFEVGVHIADVGYFVKLNTALDRDARKRATSVYLVQRAVPMLPPALSESLCSLVPGQDRLSFSALFTMTSEGQVIGFSFEKTVINSCAKLTYSDAQRIIEGSSPDHLTLESETGHSPSKVAESIRVLYQLAKSIRQRRMDNGALKIDDLKLSFKLDDEGRPIDCSPYKTGESNQLIEEFMLLANMSAAATIAANLPEQALLRRHEAPMERRLEGLKNRIARFGVDVDISSGGALCKSIEEVESKDTRKIMALMTSKAMFAAKYFCSGMLDIAKYSHYALNIPLYTHFTSPIRRYADVIVHRQLAACLEQGSAEQRFAMDRDSVAKAAQQCNMKRDSAKLAEEQSAHLFLCLLINDLTEKYGPVVREAQVVNVLDEAFDVVIPEFGIEKRVHADQMPLENIVYEEHSSTINLYWTDKDVISYLAEKGEDEHLAKMKLLGDHHNSLAADASRAHQDEKALFEDDDEEEEKEDVEEIVRDQKKHGDDVSDSVQKKKSKEGKIPPFEGLSTKEGGHKVQAVRQLMKIPVIITADNDKSPPIIKVFAVNPYAQKK